MPRKQQQPPPEPVTRARWEPQPAGAAPLFAAIEAVELCKGAAGQKAGLWAMLFDLREKDVGWPEVLRALKKQLRLVGRRGLMLLLLAQAACAAGGDSRLGIPPCNAWIFLAGAADLKLDCPARAVVPVLKESVEQQPVKPAAKPVRK